MQTHQSYIFDFCKELRVYTKFKGRRLKIANKYEQ